MTLRYEHIVTQKQNDWHSAKYFLAIFLIKKYRSKRSKERKNVFVQKDSYFAVFGEIFGVLIVIKH